MSYLVLARKWRPMRFEDLVGQDHVARTLGNAIKSGRVAHAFLFTGVRGVGKTTSARILAKALNCMGDPATATRGLDPGPTTTPCLQCPACLEIAQGTDMDVREIDGASYNGVDEVRKLQDSIPYRPNRDRFKIFIVDEVHMLSQSAWNAFLKTLEEPPPHVKFIFATTEVHKVPVTILSRVQRFDFKMIPAQVVAARLRHVLQHEGIEADDAAVSVLSREAAGSMRDAMSLLDQVIAWGGTTLVGNDVARVLGVASHAVLYDLARALLGGDAARCLSIVAELSDQGFDIPHVARDTLALLRNLVVAKVCPEPATLLDLPDEEARDVTQLARPADADDLIRLHQGLAAGFDEVVKSGQPRASFEMLLVRLARRPPLVPLDALVGRLTQLERRLMAGPPRGAPGRPQNTSGPEPAPAAPRPRDPRPAREAKPDASADDGGEPPPEPSSASPRLAELSTERFDPPTPRSESPAPRLEPPPPRSESPAPRFESPPPRSESPAPRFESPPPRSESPAPRFESPSPRFEPPQSRPGPGQPRFEAAPRSVPPPSTAPPPRVEAPSELDELFKTIVARVASERGELAAKLEHAVALELTTDKFVLGWAPGSLFGELVARPETTGVVERVLAALLGRSVKVVHEHESSRASGKKTLSLLGVEERERKVREAYETARRHPRISEAVEILGARLKDLRLAKAP